MAKQTSLIAWESFREERGESNIRFLSYFFLEGVKLDRPALTIADIKKMDAKELSRASKAFYLSEFRAMSIAVDEIDDKISLYLKHINGGDYLKLNLAIFLKLKHLLQLWKALSNEMAATKVMAEEFLLAEKVMANEQSEDFKAFLLTRKSRSILPKHFIRLTSIFTKKMEQLNKLTEPDSEPMKFIRLMDEQLDSVCIGKEFRLN